MNGESVVVCCLGSAALAVGEARRIGIKVSLASKSGLKLRFRGSWVLAIVKLVESIEMRRLWTTRASCIKNPAQQSSAGWGKCGDD